MYWHGPLISRTVTNSYRYKNKCSRISFLKIFLVICEASCNGRLFNCKVSCSEMFLILEEAFKSLKIMRLQTFWLVHCYGLPQGRDTLYFWRFDCFTAMNCPSGEIHCTYDGLVGSLLWTAPGVRYIVLVIVVLMVHCYGLPQGWDTLYLW